VKLAGARAAAFCARPDGRLIGALLYGPDDTLVALRRRELVRALTGGDEMRLTRLEPGVAAADPAAIDAALRARAFFPGRRVLLIEGAGDALARPLGVVLAGTAPEDAFLVVTAGGLSARSALRKLFETHAALAALAFYPDPPGAEELSGMLAAAGLADGLAVEAAGMLRDAACGMDRGALGQFVEMLGVYGLDREAPLGAAEVAALLPQAAESQLDELVAAVAEGRAEQVGLLMARLAAAGVGPVAALIATGRHFRLLFGVAVAPGGPEAAIGRLRPPAFGPRRDALAAQARRWESGRLEAALRLLFQTDRALRSPGSRPDRAMVERCLMRIAMLAPRG
jgi:DNA polymerase-3 subunit delta